MFLGSKESSDEVNDPSKYALLQRKNSPTATWQNFVNSEQSPTYCIMDLGCTRCMGSQKAVEAFIEAGTPHGIRFEWQRCNTKMSFANSKTETLEWCVIVTWPTTPPISTTIDVHPTGTVPILLSLSQMMNLEMKLDLCSDAVYCECAALGYYSEPLEFSTSRHVVMDLARLRYNPGITGDIFAISNGQGDHETTQVFR